MKAFILLSLFRYNDGKYNKSGCYESGQHCWDNQCHNGTLCICDHEMCNDPAMPTSSPHPETPGSGLECWYGVVSSHGDPKNLTTDICDKNETMCVVVYDGESGDTWFSCHDPASQDGAFNQTDACFDDAIYCSPPRHSGKKSASNISLMIINF